MPQSVFKDCTMVSDEAMKVSITTASDPTVDFPRRDTDAARPVFGPSATQPRHDLTADEQIRMKALECAVAMWATKSDGADAKLFPKILMEFEDYLRNRK